MRVVSCFTSGRGPSVASVWRGPPTFSREVSVDEGLSPTEAWRRDVFVSAGFNAESAELLALSDVETSVVLLALEAGCSPVTAVDIFV